MKKHVKTTALMAALISGAMTTGIAQAGDHSEAKVWADDQAVSEGTVTAKKVTAEANGWLVVHRTGETMKPGPSGWLRAPEKGQEYGRIRYPVGRRKIR